MSVHEWVRGNGKILKDCTVRLARYNGGVALDRVQPHLKRIRFGPSPFDREWDLLVVLDTCRPDMLQEVAPEYDFLPDEIPTTRSPASWSRDWLVKAFDRERYADEMARTAFVAWNPFTEYECDPDDWLHLDEAHDAWDNDLGLIPPSTITDRTITARRDLHPDRLIAWYQQPHTPYRTIEQETLTDEEIGTINLDQWTVWDRVHDPNDPLSWDDVREGYLDNLRWALDEVAVLLKNVDAEKAVITADHGELLGEWRMHGHGAGMPFPELIRVPWVETTATDTRTRAPVVESPADNGGDVEERLAALGYAE